MPCKQRNWIINTFKKFNLLMRERGKHQFIVPLVYAFIGWFLYVPRLGIESTTLVYQDHTLWPTELHSQVLTSFLFLFFTVLLNLLVWHWLINLYGFHVYDSVIYHLCIVLCVHHPTSSLLPSPFIPPITLFYLPWPPFLVVTMLLWVSMSFFPLSPFTFFTQTRKPPVLCSVLYQWVCFCFVY